MRINWKAFNVSSVQEVGSEQSAREDGEQLQSMSISRLRGSTWFRRRCRRSNVSKQGCDGPSGAASGHGPGELTGRNQKA